MLSSFSGEAYGFASTHACIWVQIEPMCGVSASTLTMQLVKGLLRKLPRK